jgi:hypothetical protein
MKIPSKVLIALISLFLFIPAAPPIAAQEQAQSNRDPSSQVAPLSSSVGPRRVLTGKERLGEKWQDEQRLDNCNVPADKRGAKRRPDACPSAASE